VGRGGVFELTEALIAGMLSGWKVNIAALKREFFRLCYSADTPKRPYSRKMLTDWLNNFS
jgi:hypothetical protein